eukprot:2718232-Pyramimonas_sp.AAC.1
MSSSVSRTPLLSGAAEFAREMSGHHSLGGGEWSRVDSFRCRRPGRNGEGRKAADGMLSFIDAGAATVA